MPFDSSDVLHFSDNLMDTQHVEIIRTVELKNYWLELYMSSDSPREGLNIRVGVILSC